MFLYSLGQSFRVSGRFEEAIRSYELFLDRGQPGPVLRAVVECHVANMRAELERAAMTMPPTDQPSDEARVTASPRVDTTASAPRWYDDPAGFALTGVGLVAAGVGGGLLFNAASLKDDALTEDREPVRDDLRAKADTRRLWGGVVTAAGIATLAAGIVKLALVPDAPRERAGIALGPGPGTFGLVGRF